MVKLQAHGQRNGAMKPMKLSFVPSLNTIKRKVFFSNIKSYTNSLNPALLAARVISNHSEDHSGRPHCQEELHQ